MSQLLSLYAKTHLYASNLVAVAVGTFSPDGPRQLVVARGSLIEVLDLVEENEEFSLKSICRHDTFAIVRHIEAFRIAGTNVDRLLVTSDSGKFSVIEYDNENARFKALYNEPYGKTGIRRTIPGEYLAVDAKGRAAMVASIEKNKLVYVLNRDSNANVTVSSPLEANTASHLVYDLVALDVGYENPVFASLEVNYEDGPTKHLTFYELDLGLNSVLRKSSVVVPSTANRLIAIPGGEDGPSGVIVCTTGFLWYFDLKQRAQVVPIPRTSATAEVPFIVCGAVHSHQGDFLVLVQSQSGTIYNVGLEYEGAKVQGLSVKFLASSVTRATSMVVIKPGYLFLASELGDNTVQMVTNLGSEEGITSEQIKVDKDLLTKGVNPSYDEKYLIGVGGTVAEDEEEADSALYEAASMTGLHPVMDLQVDGQAIVTASGSGLCRSEFGVRITETASSPLATRPVAVFTTKTKDSEDDKYLIMSFAEHSMVLELGERIEEAKDSPFRVDVATIAVQLLGQGSLAQVYSRGIRLVSTSGETNEWTPEDDDTVIIAASTNAFQVAILLSTQEIIYFELDEEGSLNEYEEKKPAPDAVCISVGAIPQGKARSPFLAVGYKDSSLRLFSLSLDTMLETLTMQALTAPPSGILLAPVETKSNNLYLHITLENGVYICSKLDNLSGELSDTHTRFLGSVTRRKLFPCHGGVVVGGTKCQPWIVHSERGKLDITPILYEPITALASFYSSTIANGMVAISGSDLKVLTSDLVSTVDQQVFPVARNIRNIVVVGTMTAIMSTGRDESRQWTSGVTVTDKAGQVVYQETLESDTGIFSAGTARLDGKDYLFVGTATAQVHLPRPSCKEAHVYVYQVERGEVLFLHKTPVEQAPLAIAGFQELGVVIGVGSRLRLYNLGKKQLLRKAELTFEHESQIRAVACEGNRVVVGDQRYSVTFVVFKPELLQFLPFATDSVPRHVTCLAMLDYDTVMIGDRFGSVSVLRCPDNISQLSDEDSSGVALATRPAEGNKLELLCNYYVGDYITAIRPTRLHGREVVFVSGLQGTVMSFAAIASKHDSKMLTELEQALRRRGPSIVGRDHLVYRGYYSPVRSVIDGDLVSQFSQLVATEQKEVSATMDRLPREIEKKIGDMRIM